MLSLIIPGAGELYATNWEQGWANMFFSYLVYPAGIVACALSVNVSYQNYAWKIVGNTTLKSNLSGHNIKYGINCGYTDMPNIAYTRYFEIADGNFEFLESIFVDASPYVNAAFWWDTYMALIEKPSLTQEEQDLYDACVDE